MSSPTKIKMWAIWNEGYGGWWMNYPTKAIRVFETRAEAREYVRWNGASEWLKIKRVEMKLLK